MEQENDDDLTRKIFEEIRKLELELGKGKEGKYKPSYELDYENPKPEETKELELSIPQIKLSFERPHVNSMINISGSLKAEKYLRMFFEPGTLDLQERFVVLFLNHANDVLGYQIVSFGGLTATIVDIRLILSAALKCLSTAIILCHNHPSGKLQFSQNDLNLTTELKKAASYHQIKVLDHIILTSEGFKSMVDEGLI